MIYSEEYIKCVKEQKEKADKFLGSRITVGKKGFVELINYMGSDKTIVESARQSYNMGNASLTEEKTVSMIRSMTKSGHTSPFEQASITFKIKMPIFVARQWIRTRTASVNESSMRYTKSNGDCWLPEDHTWEMRKSGGYEKKDFEQSLEDAFEKAVQDANEASVARYEEFIDRKIPPEIARIVLPLSSYTEFVWTIDLNNFRKMLSLRLDSHAQREIFQFACATMYLANFIFPITISSFFDDSFLNVSLNLNDLGDLLLKNKLIGFGKNDSLPFIAAHEDENNTFEENIVQKYKYSLKNKLNVLNEFKSIDDGERLFLTTNSDEIIEYVKKKH